MSFNKTRNFQKVLLLTLFILLPLAAKSQTQDFKCADCHEVTIDKSVHKGVLVCQDCHDDAKDEGHIDNGVKKVN